MLRLQAQVAATGRLDGGRHGGALLPRLVEPVRPPGDPDSKRDLFHYVLRVPVVSWDVCDVVRLGEAHQLYRHELMSGLTVACVPVIADPAELRFERRTDRRAYRIAPLDAKATINRIEEIVVNLDRSGAVIAVAPELTLTPVLLERWQGVLAARNGSRLRWLVAGSGPHTARGGRPTNTAILLDARTGEVLGHQEKQHAFDFGPEELRRWQLESRLGSHAVVEDLARGRRLTVFDAGAQRIAVLVCEDLARIVEIGPLLFDFGISHVLAPVFGRPIQRHRWEQQAAEVHVRTIGSTVIVANSMVMQTITGRPGGTALVVPPVGEALVGSVDDPARPVCFRLLPCGAAQHC